MSDLLATALEVKLREQIADTVAAVKEIVPQLADHAADRDAKGATVRKVADILKLDKSAAWRRLRAAEDAGFIVNLEDRKGRPGRYRVTGERLTVTNEELLPTPEELEDAHDDRP
jgi:hypothetical protein